MMSRGWLPARNRNPLAIVRAAAGWKPASRSVYKTKPTRGSMRALLHERRKGGRGVTARVIPRTLQTMLHSVARAPPRDLGLTSRLCWELVPGGKAKQNHFHIAVVVECSAQDAAGIHIGLGYSRTKKPQPESG